MKKAFAGIALLLGLAGRPARAGDAEDAAALVRDAVEAVLGCLRDADMAPEAKREKIVGIIEPVFDFALMGKLALGERNWTAMSPSEREEFTALFTRRLKDSYLGKIELFTEGEVVYEPPRAAGNKIHVATRVRSKSDDVKVVYKLYRKGAEGWRGYDFEIEGVSMIASYRSQYAEVLSSGTAKDLLARMREQAGGAGR